jgi:hypothetical protein
MGVKLSLILREKHRLRVFENRALGRLFEAKRDEIIGCWRKMHNEELHNLYSSPNIIMQNDQAKEVEMCRACTTHEEENCTLNFGGKAGRNQTGRKDLDIGGRIIIKQILEK